MPTPPTPTNHHVGRYGAQLAAGPIDVAGIRAEQLVLEAEDEIRRRLADPWAHTDRLVITSVEPWNLIVGAERLSGTLAS